MTRDELKGIEGLTEAQIEAVMAIHGRDTQTVNAAKADLEAKVASLQQQLKTAKDGLKAFDGVDVNGLQTKITELQTKITEQQEGFAFESELRRAAREAGALNEDDVLALLPGQDTLRHSQNRKEDIAAALEQFKAQRAYLFSAQGEAKTDTPDSEPESPPIVVPKARGAASSAAVTLADFAKMDGGQRAKLHAKDPTLFAKLREQMRLRR